MTISIPRVLNAIFPSESLKLEKSLEITEARLREAHRRVRQACKIDIGEGQEMTIHDDKWFDNGQGVRTRLEDETKAVNMEAIFQPFSEVPIHIHKDNEEVFLIIEGYLIETVTGRKIEKGQFLVVPKNTHHGFDAPEGARARVILKEKL